MSKNTATPTDLGGAVVQTPLSRLSPDPLTVSGEGTRLLASAASGGRTADQAEAADEPENDQGASEAGGKQLVTELPGLLAAGRTRRPPGDGPLVAGHPTAKSTNLLRSVRAIGNTIPAPEDAAGRDRPASQMRPAGDGERHNGNRCTCLTPDPPLILAGGELWLAGCGAAADMSRGQG